MYWHSLSSGLMQGEHQQYTLLNTASVLNHLFLFFLLFNRINHICWGSVVLWLSVLTAKLLWIFVFYSMLKLWPLRIFPRLSAEKHYSYSNWHSCVEKVVFPLPKKSVLCQINSLTLTMFRERDQPQYLSCLCQIVYIFCCLVVSLHIFESFSDFFK